METQNQIYQKYIQDVYRELVQLNDSEQYRTILVQRKTDGRIFVKKEVPLAQGGVYQQLQSIHHPNLVCVHQVCLGQEKCLVLEDYVSGRTLRQELDARGRLPMAQAIHWIFHILDGLEEIHKYHMIHRDIKPENILISVDGVVKLLDFGIARFEKNNQSKDTVILGTAGYASPEQFGFRQTDVRADIYAVGVLLCNMLTGKMPDEELPSDENMRYIITKCTQIDPGNRFLSIQALKTQLWVSAGGKAPQSRSWPAQNGNGQDWSGRKEQPVEATWVPGFRTGVTWKKILACVGYVFLLLGTGINISEVAVGGPLAVVLELIALTVYIWLTLIIGTNLCRWDRKMPIIRKLPPEWKISLRVVLCLFTLYFGALLENYVKYTMLGWTPPT